MTDTLSTRAAELPITPVLPDLACALERGRNAVLEAPPGAGKTTRVPLALLDAPWLAGRKIVMLEPRRLAARAAARYMAESLGEEVGATIGYRVRLDTKVSAATRIEVVTEGILTRLLQADPELREVGLVIFDEFHERSLQADLGLALCLESQSALRDDLRLLVMSATLNGASVSALLENAPVIRSEGRSFPVDVHYLPAPARDRSGNRTLTAEVTAAVLRALQQEAGSALVFLPGVAEIKRVAGVLHDRDLGSEVEVLPLYGDLSAADQEHAIRPAQSGTRKIVLATNIAETSLTIEGVRVVVDAGLMRAARFDPGVGMTRLQTLTVSRASADQRCGRAGRLEPGVCYRLWSESQQRGFVPFNQAEIVTADLAPLALELAVWGVADPLTLRWLDPPPAAAYQQARELLTELGALDDAGRITGHGRDMAALAMHPRLAHMLLKGRELGVGTLACELAALLSERDVLRGAERGADLRDRLLALRARRSHGDIARGALQRVRQSARQWQRQLGLSAPPKDKDDLAQAGVLLAFAYPDRIARRRPGSEPRYLLAGGRGAYLAQPEPLAAAPYLVAGHLDAGAAEARIFLAAEISVEALRTHFADRIESKQFVRWDKREQAVLARRQQCLGQLVLSDEALAEADPQRVCTALLAGVRELGLDALPWTDKLRAWQQRVQFLHRLWPDDWPDVSDPALTDTLEQWLAPFVMGVTRIVQLQKLDLGTALAALLTWEQRRALDELAPTHLTVPSGSRIALDYEPETPVLAVRLQEMFGATDTPRIAGGRVAVLLHLLSPARRAVQVTRDLASFWSGAYHEVKKDLRGRYPKHHWPDDPLHAEPTRRTKRR